MTENRANTKSKSRTIPLKKVIIGPTTPRPVTVKIKKVRDYPGVPEAYVKLARKLGSPLLSGPPLCDELMAFLKHTFTEEEARVAQHLSGLTGMSAAQVARAGRLDFAEVSTILNRLGYEKFAIAGQGPPENRRYRLQPIMPGIFEMVLIGEDPKNLSPWHQRFAELFEALYETGYARVYNEHRAPFVRFLPVQKSLQANPMALPSDRLEVVLDRYQDFGIGNCQCRMVMDVVGQGCGKPMGNCLIMGKWGKAGIRNGQLKRVSRKEALEIKLEAETYGLVSWIMNMESGDSNGCCSCCGCCCHAMRIVNEFNVPGLIAPPHFLPNIDRDKCTYCGVCARACPMGSLAVDVKGKKAWQLEERCIGCGLCSLACDKARAITMEPVPDYKLPPNSWFGLISRSVPNVARNLFNAWRQY